MLGPRLYGANPPHRRAGSTTQQEAVVKLQEGSIVVRRQTVAPSRDKKHTWIRGIRNSFCYHYCLNRGISQ